jgi:hypothetical protein
LTLSDFVTLSCPTCGGRLEITKDIERFACGYCGNEHVVRRGGGIVSLIPIADDIKGIKTGVDKTAAELAIIRLTKELEDLRNQRELKKEIRREVITEFYNNHVVDNSIYASLDFPLYRYIYCLIEEVDGLEVPVDMSDLNYKKYFKERIFTLTEDDLKFLTERALLVAVNPEYQKQIRFRNLIDEFLILSDKLFNNEIIIKINKEIQGVESELARMKKIVSE